MFQQKIEWVRLMEQHADKFEEAKSYEKNALEHWGSPFTWSQGELLVELSRPEHRRKSRAEHEIRVARLAAKRRPNPLRVDHEPLDIDELYGQAKVCLDVPQIALWSVGLS